ncbi:hypothetical protein [Dyadobacter frigoris]|uniref:Uncharacterized protein n=1 Tax=Dyadobacter frigoris TaxID=2576211 RepID=A0A4U6CXS1_9BACT|nr:hypothetical protein [Dyadobacter frigoris]TKT88537.1 hypothetical protein FDK13_26670 [Dyadobacter frigoris]GLU54585.1 hypothetical protein Dfri01_40460 [Dyadobacter frigoris]
MRLLLFVFAYLLPISFAISQNVIDWNPKYELQDSDFQASRHESGGNISVYAACTVGFGYQMNGYQFMFTKNFNSKVNTTFTRNASYIIAADTISRDKLLKFARAEFDLSELYARKFRQLMFEKKNAFSDPNFYQKLYEQIHVELAARNSQLSLDTNAGLADIRLKEQHEKILAEIDALADFCKECKPKKKKD